VLLAVGGAPIGVDGQDSQVSAELEQHIANLGALDFPVRMHAARLIRRTPGAEAVPLLAEAARQDPNEFVRYRALVLLTAFNDPGTRRLMEDLIRDRNDRVREVVYKWLEQHPDSRMADLLVLQLQTEQAEFVRPALVGAVAALGALPAVQRPMLAETARGLDFFRSAVIESLGRHRAAYALDAIVIVSRLQGPLQDDAILAIGRIGGPDAAAMLNDVTDLPTEAMLARHAARCLIGERCADQIVALVTAASAAGAAPAQVRAAVDALSAIAQSGDWSALDALMGLAGRSGAHDRVAVAFGSAALRQPGRTVSWLEQAEEGTREAAISMLKDGFDSLEEDFAEEQFFAAVRAGYWRATDGSPGRAVRASLIQRLEF
jgi:hypothetical protein